MTGFLNRIRLYSDFSFSISHFFSLFPFFFYLFPFTFYLLPFTFYLPSSAQPPGNEWILYNQKYLELKIADTGIYRINYNVLAQGLNKIGESITNINPQNIQLYGRGEEQFIYIEGESDGSFDPSDFIEFYAVQTDGWFDSRLYVNSTDQSDPYYSLFNDTATYYLTISSSVPGKRMGILNFTQPTISTEPYFLKEDIITYKDYYYQGEFYGSADGPAHPLYKAGEGWFSNSVSNNAGNSITANINTTYHVSGTGIPDAILKVVIAGTNSKSHQVKINYSSFDTTDIFNGYLLRKHNLTLPANSLSSGNTVIKVSSLSSPDPSNPDLTAVSHVYFKYARNFYLINNTELEMLLPASSNTSYIQANYNDTTPYIYDLTSHYRIETKQQFSPANTLQALIPPANTERKIYFTPSGKIKYVASLIPVTGSGMFTDFSGNPDSAFVIITHASLMDKAMEYGNYRDDINHDSVVADIEELYDQFAYGINKHPLAIKNFCRFLLNAFPIPPQHLFIIGKGISDASFSTRNNTSLYAQNLVPTYGWPGGDVAFTSGINGQIQPAIPTGRLAAKTGTEVKDYLEKVKAFESKLIETEVTQQNIPGRIWMKHAIHFCGGNNAQEGNQLCSYLKQYEDTLEADLYGGFVTTISKTSTAPIEVNLVTKQIEEGVSLLTFFGHSSANYIDVSIGYASDYNFKPGHYPFMIVNGCFSGDIYTLGSQSTSEDFVLTAGKGAIGYIAHTGLGYPGDLHKYTGSLYNNISKKSYGKSIGKCIQAGIVDNQPTEFIAVATALGMTLHGDPAVNINTHAKPDYAIAPEFVFFSPPEVTSDNESFDINIVISNLGMAKTDSLSIFISRTLPNGDTASYTRVIPPVFYRDTVAFSFPVDVVNGVGLNNFYVRVDPENKFDELAELNNVIGQNQITLFIRSGDLIPVYPYNYQVVPKRSITLQASTSDPFALSKEYIFQIDTTDLYNSAKFQYATFNSAGGVVKWNIDSNYFNLPDSTAFFWRTSPNIPPNYRWREHSFQVIKGKSGWGQKHFYQFKNDNYTGIDYLRDSLLFKFKPQQKGLRCDVWGHPDSTWKYDQTQFLINNAQQDYNTGTYNDPAIYLAIIDKCSLVPWGTCRWLNGILYNPDYDFGNCNSCVNQTCGRTWKVELYFIFRINDPVQMDSLRNLLNNKVPKGNYILAYCFGDNLFSTNYWDASHKQAFYDLGATLNGPDVVPYIFFGQKGNPAAAQELFGDSANDFISLNAPLTGCLNEGSITSTVIGPGEDWGSLHWNFRVENPVRDSTEIAVMNSISNNEKLEGLKTFSGSVVPLNDSVKASDNPYIKLKAKIKDDSLFTAAQLAHWYVLYDEIPEAALNPKIGYSFYSAALQQGDLLKFHTAIENVSTADMDSLRIRYWVEDASRNILLDTITANAPLPAGKIMYDTISFPTRISSNNFLSGNCRFWVEVNPMDTLWQLEQYHFNNVAALAFDVKKDNVNPLLDVTFDGIRILNGDIVSPKPEIVIQLKDENKFLAMDDTSAIKIFITNPDRQSERVYFVKNGTEQMPFTKAALPENKCKIEYRPTFLKDGIYELRVQGNDRSGNDAGDLEYSITFEVINKSTITEILNYPNPFSSSTRFVFTLTGAEIPEYFKLQIITVTGKVVREITREEIGNIHIGRNITDFSWNGTDEYGDPLANGVYLYRAIVKINGEDIEHRQSNADSYFKKGFGKMYLMR